MVPLCRIFKEVRNIKILFLAHPEYSVPMLEWTIKQGFEIFAIVLDSDADCPVYQIALRKQLPVISLQDVYNRIDEKHDLFDMVISCLFPRKIKEPLLSYPHLGCINFHPAPLPDWKGLGGCSMAILNRLKEWGSSAHYIDSGIDTGEIIRVFRFHFDYRMETAFSLKQKTNAILFDLYKSVLEDLDCGMDLKKNALPNEGGTYVSKKQLLEMMRIDPENDDVALKCQAFWFPPYSGAFIEINGIQYTLVNDFILSAIANISLQQLHDFTKSLFLANWVQKMLLITFISDKQHFLRHGLVFTLCTGMGTVRHT